MSTDHDGTLEWHDGDMPYSPVFGDHFYCRADGRAECGHVFLAGNDLPHRWRDCRDGFVIGELGFGAGLNFCETWRQWQIHRPAGACLTFVSHELYPMTKADMARALSRWPELERQCHHLGKRWPDHPSGMIDLEMDAQTRLIVVCGEALDNVRMSSRHFDAWFLDGFTPARNGAMWSAELMTAIYEHTKSGGTFATYSAAGFVRRNLIAAGFVVKKRAGFAGKREMLAGCRP